MRRAFRWFGRNRIAWPLPLLLPLLVVLFLPSMRVGQSGRPVMVRLHQGDLRGRAVGDGSIHLFMGIPFAAPPVGPLRWRPPQPAEGWSGVRNALLPGAPCMQPRVVTGIAAIPSEDCLFLNVWSPVHARGLPVMVFIHGGGFLFGSGAEPTYDGTALARHGVVLVTLNYRLGIFGFLAHPALTRESGSEVADDGLLDQVAALRWVRANIAAFGGDPDRVTLFGESAGGTSVGMLLVSPLAQGLFRQAILESPSLGWRMATLAEAERMGSAISTDIDMLRRVPATSLLAWSSRIQPREPVMAPTALPFPVVDGKVLPDQPMTMFERGQFAGRPIIVGDNADEGANFAVRWASLPPADYPQRVSAMYGAFAPAVMALYPAHEPLSVLRAGSDMIGDGKFYVGARVIARSMAAKTPQTFSYLFTQPIRGHAPWHATELRYVFGTLGPDAGPQDKALSEAMMSAWTRFAATGDPDGGRLPSWPHAREARDPYLAFGKKIQAGAGFREAPLDLMQQIVTPQG